MITATIIHQYLQELFDDLFIVDYLTLSSANQGLVVKKYGNSGCKFSGAYIIFILEGDSEYYDQFIQFMNTQNSNENAGYKIGFYTKNDIIHNNKFIVYINP